MAAELTDPEMPMTKADPSNADLLGPQPQEDVVVSIIEPQSDLATIPEANLSRHDADKHI